MGKQNIHTLCALVKFYLKKTSFEILFSKFYIKFYFISISPCFT